MLLLHFVLCHFLRVILEEQCGTHPEERKDPHDASSQTEIILCPHLGGGQRIKCYKRTAFYLNTHLTEEFKN